MNKRKVLMLSAEREDRVINFSFLSPPFRACFTHLASRVCYVLYGAFMTLQYDRNKEHRRSLPCLPARTTTTTVAQIADRTTVRATLICSG